ncbi:MAG: hypothetical protein Ct9H300mP1_26990 [Planctomycetaceae bacterium]|nr:MAG: hypothetical protein Ct9H300mP1_26990 [Planctomycetaceae bacterium]
MLDHVLFPVGDASKSEIRETAERAGLRVFDKPDSQESASSRQRYAGFLRRHRGELDTAARWSNRRDGRRPAPGYERFTVGKRRGLGIAFGDPGYVVAIEPESTGCGGQTEDWPEPRWRPTVSTGSSTGTIRPMTRLCGARHRSATATRRLRQPSRPSEQTGPCDLRQTPVRRGPPDRRSSSTTTTACWEAAGSDRTTRSGRGPAADPRHDQPGRPLEHSQVNSPTTLSTWSKISACKPRSSPTACRD